MILPLVFHLAYCYYQLVITIYLIAQHHYRIVIFRKKNGLKKEIVVSQVVIPFCC